MTDELQTLYRTLDRFLRGPMANEPRRLCRVVERIRTLERIRRVPMRHHLHTHPKEEMPSNA